METINDKLRILVINPGSTSTKIAFYENDKCLFTESIVHPASELEQFACISDQLEFRRISLLNLLSKQEIQLESIDAVVGRGGMLPPVKSGCYIVTPSMIDVLLHQPALNHASNLGAPLAYDIAQQIGVEAYIYDSVRVDELSDLARFSGYKSMPRTSTLHTLNSRAVSIEYAKSTRCRYEDLNLIVAHLGGGISLSLHSKGKIIDIVSDDEGPFSTGRCGRLPCSRLVNLCFSRKYSASDLIDLWRNSGGLMSYLNTTDAREVESWIAEGDSYAKEVYEAMAYQVAKGIGELATVVNGDIDAVILTGGIAFSNMFTSWISERVSFIAQVFIFPGENEMYALAMGTLRVLRGEEIPNIFKI